MKKLILKFTKIRKRTRTKRNKLIYSTKKVKLNNNNKNTLIDYNINNPQKKSKRKFFNKIDLDA